jgi:hypothetical protein
MCEKLIEPGHEGIPRPERRVHPDETVPLFAQTVLSNERRGRDESATVTRCGDVEVEAFTQCRKYALRGVPFVGLPNCFPVPHHAPTFKKAADGLHREITKASKMPFANGRSTPLATFSLFLILERFRLRRGKLSVESSHPVNRFFPLRSVAINVRDA